MTIELTELDIRALRQTVFDRLHGHDAGGPPLDGGDAFAWFVDAYRGEDVDFKQRLALVLGKFLDEIADPDRWPELAANNLLDLIQEIGDLLETQIFEFVRSGRLLADKSRGKKLHSGLLKCLISIGHIASPSFWLQQFDRLGPESGALIMSGLCDHGLPIAMSELPKLSQHETARDAISYVWRHLVDQYGLDEVYQALNSVSDQLAPDTYAMYRDDLIRLGAILDVSAPTSWPPAVNQILQTARDFEVQSPVKLSLFST